jgi:hypothetical protein
MKRLMLMLILITSIVMISAVEYSDMVVKKADERMNMLHKELELNLPQYKSIREVVLKQVNEMFLMRGNREERPRGGMGGRPMGDKPQGDNGKRPESMDKLREKMEAYEKEICSFLNKEQLEKYNKWKEERQSKRPQRF